MIQPHIPAHDADSARDANAASTPSYPQRSAIANSPSPAVSTQPTGPE